MSLTQLNFHSMVVRISYLSLIHVNFQGMVVRILHVLKKIILSRYGCENFVCIDTSEFSRCGYENFIHILTQFYFQGMVVRISYMSLTQVNFQGMVVKIVYIH